MVGTALRGGGCCEPGEDSGGSGHVERGGADFADDGPGDGDAGEGDEGWFAAAGTDLCRRRVVSERGRACKQKEGVDDVSWKRPRWNSLSCRQSRALRARLGASSRSLVEENLTKQTDGRAKVAPGVGSG